ncbi:MAG: hypothetical protein OGMRLDGQ_002481 [Candidatus Fervidibacter sp.]
MRKLKVLVWARDERDADYLQRLLQGGKGIVLCEPAEKADAVVTDAELLTRAEKEVLQAIARYGSVKEVAKRTFRSEATVKKHLRSVRQKFQVPTTVQAVALALRLRLID